MTEQEAVERLKDGLESMAYGTGAEFEFFNAPAADGAFGKYMLMATLEQHEIIFSVSGCVRRVADEESTVEEEVELISTVFADKMREKRKGSCK